MAVNTDTITSANSVYLLGIATVFPVPQRLQGFSADMMFDTEATDMAETQVGADGYSAAGWLPRATPQTITLIASSPSIDVFEQWIAAQDELQEVLYATAQIQIPSIRRTYTAFKGVLRRGPMIAPAHRVLQPRAFTIEWLPDLGQPAMSYARL